MSAESTIKSDWVGRVIDGRFPLVEWLGGGTDSAVFLTELPGTQEKKAAIKLMLDDGVNSEATVASWTAARPLTHPNLMRLLHAGRCESDGVAVLFVVSEYADEILSEILPQRALSLAESRVMLEPVMEALLYLHGKGMVHGHLKPENVLVVNDRLKISGDRLQVAGAIGKPPADLSIYDAPERADGTISPVCDAWSMGVLLVSALTQRPPFWDRESGGAPVVPASIPEPLAGIARACLRVDPATRCTVVRAKKWLETGQPSEEDLAADRKKKPLGRLGILVLVAAVVVAAAIAVVELRPRTAGEPGVPAQTAEGMRSGIEKPSPSVAAGSAARRAPESETAESETPAAQTPEMDAAETHASKPIQMQDINTSGAVAQRVMPEYLPKALETIHGEFVVRVRVTTDQAGNVTNAAYESAGPSGYFAKSALEAAKKWKFKPTAGAPGKWILQFVFTREGPQVSTEPVQ